MNDGFWGGAVAERSTVRARGRLPGKMFGSEGGGVSHELSGVDVTRWSKSQLDLLWMDLRAADIAFAFDGEVVALPEDRLDDVRQMMAAILEHREPTAVRYPTPRPFRRVSPNGATVASRWRRLGGATIDSFLITGIYVAAAALDVSPWSGAVVIAVYTIGVTHWWGRTIGKWVVGTEVVDAGGAGRPSWSAASVRWALLAAPGLAGAVVAPIAPLGLVLLLAQIATYAPILWDPAGQGLHDRAARTYVVRSAQADPIARSRPSATRSPSRRSGMRR